MHRTQLTDLLHLGITMLPRHMQSSDAARMLAAIGYQESDWSARRQGRDGPARGYFQFEVIGVEEVFRHPTTRHHARALLQTLDYPDALTPRAVQALLEHNDLLAVGIARLALWRHPDPLPRYGDDAWRYYEDLWRPGRPHPHAWVSAWDRACDLYPVPALEV